MNNLISVDYNMTSKIPGILLMSILIFVMITMNIYDIDPSDHFKWKLYIFVCVSLFDIVVSLLTTAYNNKFIKLGSILRDAMVLGMASVIAYTLFLDFRSKRYNLISHNNELLGNFILSGMISVSALIAYMCDHIIQKLDR